MIVRKYESGDLQRVKDLLAAQPFEYVLPTLSDGRYMAKVAVLSEGQPVAFGFSRKITEAFLLIDHSWGTPYQRWLALQEAHNAAVRATIAQGIDKSVTFIPREIDRAYGRRLKSLGWDRQHRSGFTYEVGA